MASSPLDLIVNGRRRTVEVDPATSLLLALRDTLDLTGSKYGCGEGQCGACTVLLDGRPVRSCITPVGSVGARPIVTIEGVANGEQLHPVQQAFLAENAMQCGYCTPGMVLSAVALLDRTPTPTGVEVTRAMDGNVCRCGTYSRIVAAIRRAAATRAEAGHD